MGRDGTFGVIL